MLLPLPVAKARTSSLENHLALVTMRHGHGNADVVSLVSCLLKAVYVACFLYEALNGRSLEPFHKAKRPLSRRVKRVKLKEGWSMFDKDGAMLKMIRALNKISSLVGLSANYSHT